MQVLCPLGELAVLQGRAEGLRRILLVAMARAAEKRLRMKDHKDCDAPSGPGVIHELPPQSRRERVKVKCSTCANRKCRQRGSAVEWLHCGMWMPKLE